MQCSLKNDSMLHGQARLIVQDNKAAKQEIEFNLKNEKASEMNEVIERIIHHVNTEWGIKVMLKDKTKMPEAKELWAGAYTEQWNLPLSKLNK